MPLKRPPSEQGWNEFSNGDAPPSKKMARRENDDSDEEEEEDLPRRPAVLKKFPNGTFKVRRLTYKTTRTNDDIHTNIDICPVFLAVLDTPQVQRLKNLRQLGVAYFVYMAVTHTRFEHSLGVAYLSDWLCKVLARQKKLGITEKDILCVKIAGLCHDLGHGPFSHVFDGEFIARVQEAETAFRSRGGGNDNPYANYPPIPDGWKHEDASLMMIDALLAHLGMEIDENNLDTPLKQIGDGVDSEYFGISPKAFFGGSYTDDKKPLTMDRVLTSRDWIFIKECIIGGPLKGNSDYVGREREKEFLYDIVSNRHTGLDVDKIDYFARDQRKANKDAGEIDGHLIRDAFVAWGRCSRPEKCFRCKSQFADEGSAKVAECSDDDEDDILDELTKEAEPEDASGEGDDSRKGKVEPGHVSRDGNDSKKGMHLMICYPEKLIGNAIDFFHTRFKLHRQIYYHKSSKPVEFMICDILSAADLHILIQTKAHPKGLPISRAMVDPEAYLKLRDSIIDVISFSDKPELAEAQALIKRLDERDLYKYATGQVIREGNKMLWQKSEEEIRSELVGLPFRHAGGVTLSSNDVFVEKCMIHHGAKDKNPVSFMRFLPKRDMPALSRPINRLPEAREFDDDEFVSDTVQKFHKQSIRVYSRSRSQETVDLLTHTFAQWVISSMQGPSCIAEIMNDDDDFDDERKMPRMCSQETPVKARGHASNFAEVSVHNEDPPSPVHKRAPKKLAFGGGEGSRKKDDKK